MPQDAWSPKRERQYEHIKGSLKERGADEEKAEEIAARMTAGTLTSRWSSPFAPVSWIATNAASNAGASPLVRSVMAAGRLGRNGPIARIAKERPARPSTRPRANEPAITPRAPRPR